MNAYGPADAYYGCNIPENQLRKNYNQRGCGTPVQIMQFIRKPCSLTSNHCHKSLISSLQFSRYIVPPGRRAVAGLVQNSLALLTGIFMIIYAYTYA